MGFTVGLWVFLRWFAVDLRWIAVVGLHLQWFLIFSFFHFTLPQTLENIFQTIFQNAIKHRKKIIFPEIIYICKHFTVENILRRNKRSPREESHPWRNLSLPYGLPRERTSPVRTKLFIKNTLPETLQPGKTANTSCSTQ